MDIKFSFIIPVYNRPKEIQELLASIYQMKGKKDFEVVVVEDGSSKDCREEVAAYENLLNIQYLYKPNSGPGNSRNYGMQRASGNYFIILDSDCLLPEAYLKTVKKYLSEHYVDCFGGPDAAHTSFSDIQKAINYTMTSYLTTGGIRGKKWGMGKFQPRSFNMGLSKKAFQITNGFKKIHPGEDPDLVLRIWKAGLKTCLIENACVFHKRRIDWNTFYTQVKKFGLVRPMLLLWHPNTAKITYWFPTLFIFGLIFSIAIAIVLGWYHLIAVYLLYFVLLFTDALIRTKNIKITFLIFKAVFIQFYGYGIHFLKSIIWIHWLKKDPKKIFPHLFFK